MNALLELRLDNSEPKCWTCGWWRGDAPSSAAMCERHDIKTLSLSVCQEWRDRDIVQQVIKRDE